MSSSIQQHEGTNNRRACNGKIQVVILVLVALWNMLHFWESFDGDRFDYEAETIALAKEEDRNEMNESSSPTLSPVFSLSAKPSSSPSSSPLFSLSAKPSSSPLFSLSAKPSSSPSSSPPSSPPSSHSSSQTSSPTSPSPSFSACMMILDDNHRLSEWLAYHHHVLPLQHLVVAVDDRSNISPTPIFNKWRAMSGMDIVEWSDSDFLPDLTDIKNKTRDMHDTFREDLKKNGWEGMSNVHKKDFHRFRQRTFVAKCMKHFNQLNRTWVMFTDIDEYLQFGGPSSPPIPNRTEASGNDDQEFIPRFPSVGERGSLLHFLEDEVRRNGTDYSSPCISIPRALMGTRVDDIKLPRHKFSNQLSNSSLNLTHQFDTLKYRVHARKDITTPYNGISKVIIDVSRLEKHLFPNIARSIHNPLPGMCGNIWEPCKGNGCLFRINHYLGSWESYSYRSNDARWGSQLKSRETYDVKANVDFGTDDDIRPWLDGFVKDKGIKTTEKLLSRAGVLQQRKDYVPPNLTKTFKISNY